MRLIIVLMVIAFTTGCAVFLPINAAYLAAKGAQSAIGKEAKSPEELSKSPEELFRLNDEALTD